MEYIVFKDFSLKSKKQLDFFSQNDPYVNIKYGEDSRRTHTKWDSNNCSWSDIMLFPYNSDHERFTLEVIETNTLSPDSYMTKEDLCVPLFMSEDVQYNINGLTFKVGLYRLENAHKYEKRIEKQNEVKDEVLTLKRTVDVLNEYTQNHL